MAVGPSPSALASAPHAPSAWPAAAAALLLGLLPFEPRATLTGVAGLRISALELAAALAAAALAFWGRHRLRVLLRRPPLPLALAAAFAIAYGVSALAAVDHRGESARFVLRMAALAVFAWVFAAAGERARRAGLLGLAAAGLACGLLAAAEGAGLEAVDPFLDLFRETRFNVGGARRATAGTAYPTLAGSWIGSGLVAAVALAGPRGGARSGLLAGALLAPGLLFTYSRGALVAAAAGLAVLVLSGRRAGGTRLRSAALGALAALGACAAGFWAHGEVFRLRLATEATASWYGARYAPAETAVRLRPGEQRETEVQVVNSGARTWRSEDGFALSYHWFDPQRQELADGGRTPLPRALGPGESATLRPVMAAPPREGCFVLLWDMVHEHTTWFSGQGVAPASVLATVGERLHCAPAAWSSELAWQPGRAELWRLALALWRDRPWTGVGPDNFRRLYGARAGRRFWDSRVYANSLPLEVAATTGLLGLAALAALLGSTLAAAARKAASGPEERRAQSAAVAALTVALAVHGLVDYLLAFTGQYLLLSFLVGSAAARVDSGEGRP